MKAGFRLGSVPTIKRIRFANTSMWLWDHTPTSVLIKDRAGKCLTCGH